MKEEKIQKKESKKWLKSVIINLIIAIVASLYLVSLMFLVNAYMFDTIIKVFTVVLLLIGIVLLERYYRKENRMIALASVEVLCIAAHTVSINHVLKLFNLGFFNYIIASIVTVLIYYILKCIIIFTIEKRKSLKNLSDISKIVKEDKPVKKEATKKKEEKQDEVVIKEKIQTIVKEETTKKEPAKTTAKKETTKKEPAKTTEKKETTKKEPAKTTAKKETTKKEPAKTTAKKETTKKEPAKTTAKKETTQKEPAKTTVKKETTKKEPAKTTAKKETTKKEPAKTTAKKETTKKEPAKATVKKETTKKVVSEKETVEEKPKRRGRPKKERAEND